MCTLAEIAEQADVQVTLEMESALDEGITTPEDTWRLLGGVYEKYPGDNRMAFRTGTSWFFGSFPGKSAGCDICRGRKSQLVE